MSLRRIVLGARLFFLGRMADAQHARHPYLVRDTQYPADRSLALCLAVAAAALGVARVAIERKEVY